MGALLGVVSKADLLDRSRLGRDKVTLTAGELMTRHVVTAPPSTTGASRYMRC
jgi:CBS domain-containing protein